MQHSKQIGLFGGTFDPIHNGHIQAALEAQKKFWLEHIYFIPTYISPFKTSLGHVSSHHRLEMIRLAIQDFTHFSTSEFELSKKETSYTIDTIKHYAKILPADVILYVIMGSDTFIGISKWKNVAELFTLCNIIVISRPGYLLRPLSEIIKDPQLLKEFVTIKSGEEYKHFTGHSIYLIQLPTPAISSTELRRKIARNEPYSSFVPPAVAEYIRTHALYAERGENAKNDQGD